MPISPAAAGAEAVAVGVLGEVFDGEHGLYRAEGEAGLGIVGGNPQVIEQESLRGFGAPPRANSASAC